MDAHEAAQLLTAAALLDARLRETDQQMLAMKSVQWSETLSYDMPLDFAHQAVRKHYSSSDVVLTPSVLNQAWKVERNRQIEQQERRQREANQGVPMPDDVRKQLVALQAKLRG
jgi:hypothetical protein